MAASSRGWRRPLLRAVVAGVIPLLLAAGGARAADLGRVRRHEVLEVAFRGPAQGPTDTPARDVELAVTFRHESGEPAVRVLGYWDGDGAGGSAGNVFKARFCPTRTGRWRLTQTTSNRPELRGQREGDELVCVASSHPGFWIADGRWYRRSDGSHPYLLGNTHYSFLSRHGAAGPVKTDPVEDIRGNARFYKKLRFTLVGDRYPDPALKPFFDEQGRPTDDGRHSCRPNPTWFSRRADPVVREGWAQDLVCDLILCGPDTPESRSTLAGDPRPWLRYVAARYGSYPNVWLCLCNEWNIKKPSYTAEQIRAAGLAVRADLPYPTPVSVHASSGDWTTALNGPWHDHVIIQSKLKTLAQAADRAAANHARGGHQPVVNDENAYEGLGDKFSKEDVVEGCLGTFLGGGYPTTGEKYGNKLGQYFWGGFDAGAHSASAALVHLRTYIDNAIEFWKLRPLPLGDSPFHPVDPQFRLLGLDGQEYVLGSNRAGTDLAVVLPQGRWRVVQVDLLAQTTRVLRPSAAGRFVFDTPASRAVLTHFRRLEAAAEPRARLNVLFISVDDLNTDLGCYGHPVVRSPHIDRLAARGVRFDRAYCQYALCNPSRSSFLSGLRPETTGILDQATAPRQRLPQAVFLPQHFRNHGYFTARVGKIYHRDDHDSWDLAENADPADPQEVAAQRRRYEKPQGQRTPDWAVLDIADEATADGTVARRIVRLMEQSVKEGKPFFLAAGFRKPHLPWAAPKRYFDLYPQATIRLPQEPALDAVPRIALMTELSGAPQPEPTWQAVAAYYACISFMDAQVGVLLDALERLKLWDNTVVVLFGDHGFHLGDHGGLWAKHTLFERAARVPLTIVVPRGPNAGQACPRLVELLDLYPTLADVCGLPAPGRLEGKSLVPLLQQPGAAWDRPARTVVVHEGVLGRSLRTERWRYTEWEDGKKGVELYDHDSDPGEYRNLASDPRHAAIVAELRQRLRQGGKESRPAEPRKEVKP
jgi:uncharacterized sulfatase